MVIMCLVASHGVGVCGIMQIAWLGIFPPLCAMVSAFYVRYMFLCLPVCVLILCVCVFIWLLLCVSVSVFFCVRFLKGRLDQCVIDDGNDLPGNDAEWDVYLSVSK